MAMENEACRLCLSTEIHRLYQPLLDQEDIEHLKASLALVTDLSDITIQPAISVMNVIMSLKGL